MLAFCRFTQASLRLKLPAFQVNLKPRFISVPGNVLTICNGMCCCEWNGVQVVSVRYSIEIYKTVSFTYKVVCI